MSHRTKWMLDDRHAVLAVAVAAVGLAACGQAPPAGAEAGPPPAVDQSSSSAPLVERDAPRVVVLGDSLTAGLGLAANEAYPARLQERLDSGGYDLQIVNAGVSGDTTAGGLRRLEWALDGDNETLGLIVALGGNDGLRGLPVDQMKKNLGEIITTAQARGVTVLLAGMEAPPNFGESYANAFRNVFVQLAQEHDVALVPFLLEGVAGVQELNQTDGIHPNVEGAARVAEHLWPAVESFVAQIAIDDAP